MKTIKRIPSALAAAYRAFVKTMGGGSGPIKPQGGGGGPVEPF